MARGQLDRSRMLRDIDQRLRSIQEGDAYHHTPKTVAEDLEELDAINASQCPWYCVTGGSGGLGPDGGPVSFSYTEEAAFTVWAYLKRDKSRQGGPLKFWAEECLADVRRALDSDLSRGGCAWLVSREILMVHDPAGQWSHFTVQDRYGFRVKNNPGGG